MLRPWLLQLQIEKSSSKTIYLQIADSFISLIKNGALQANEPLPGSRQLAAQLKVNRNTVIKALDILLVEGWLYSEERKALFVSQYPTVSQLGRKREREKSTQHPTNVRSRIIFDSGLPDINIAPIDELAMAYRRIFSRRAKQHPMADDSGLGSLSFRKSVSQMLNQKRGMQTDVSQLCITRGSQMALFLIAHTLLEEGDIVLVENPGYAPAWDTFRHAKAKIIPIRVDGKGIDVGEIEQILQETTVKAIYLTPHHQYPTTVMLSLDRRLKLAELSNQYGFTLIEDDYDNEFHFGQRPILPIASQTIVNNSIYIGTFSKMIASTLRIGYFVANAAFVERVRSLRQIIDLQGDNIMESAVLELINTGLLQKHIKKAAKIYKAKRDYFASLIDKHLKELVNYQLPEGGLAFWIELKKKQNLHALNTILKTKAISILPPENYSFDDNTNAIRLGYASLSEEQMKEGIYILKEVLTENQKGNT